MPHAALWVVQLSRLLRATPPRVVSMPHAAIPFRPHHRFAVPLPRSRRGGLVTRRFLAESRNISFPRRCGGSGERSEPIGALMPHAALWVVQLLWRLKSFFSTSVSMPHAALWVVQPTTVAGVPHIYVVSMPHAAIPFRPHHRFAVPLPRSRRGGLVRLRFLAESRNISFPRRCGGSGERSEPIGAPMPHAALWVVQRKTLKLLQILRLVSMPHAALWVVQPFRGCSMGGKLLRFNAARGFVGGAAKKGR